jgi:hypothetical protein
MDKHNTIGKIKLLEALNIDIWLLKSETFSDNKVISHDIEPLKNILIQETMQEKHRKIIEDFTNAAADSIKGININFLSVSSILEICQKKLSGDLKRTYLVICDEATKKIVAKDSNKDDGTFLINTLFSSDTITNDIKKMIWKDFIKIRDYE